MRAFLIVAAAALVLLGTPGAEALTRTPWAIHFGVSNNLFNPAYHSPFFYDIEFPFLNINTGTHGDPQFYTALDCDNSNPPAIIPAGASCYPTPSATDAGWRPVGAIPTLNPDTIGMIFLSRLADVGAAPTGTDIDGNINHVSPGHGTYPCLQAADFTFFQSFVTVASDDVVTSFTISFANMDDGARITVYNSQYPNGLIITGSYVYLGETGTTDLSPYLVAGENRILITQLDDCAVGNDLGSGTVVVDSQILSPECSYAFLPADTTSASSVSSTTCACITFE